MSEFLLIMPEIFLAMTLAAVVIGEISYHGETVRLTSAIGLMGLGGALIQGIILYQQPPAQIFGQTLAIDGFSIFFKLLFILLAALAIVTSIQTREIAPERRSEYCTLLIAACLAMCLAASASDLLLAFLSLLLLNILSFFIAGYGKRSVRSTEAAVKYMVFCSVSAALLLYGMAILFAATKTLNIYEIHKALLAVPLGRESMLVVFVLGFLALSFQIAAFPMHFWAPDVIEGAPTPASAFLSYGTRAAGLAVMLRFFISIFAQPAGLPGQWKVLGSVDWTALIAVVSGITMLLGALLAVRQKSAKRMVGYLAVVCSGQALLGLLVLDQIGIAAILFNLVTELFALIGSFYVLSCYFDQIESDQFEDLKGMLGRAVPESVCLMLFLLCLVGMPPMPGFVGKFALIGIAVRHQWPILGIAAVLSMVLSVVAVARLAFCLMGNLSEEGAAHGSASRTAYVGSFGTPWSRKAFLMVLVFPLILTGVFAETVLDWAGKSLGFILW